MSLFSLNPSRFSASTREWIDLEGETMFTIIGTGGSSEQREGFRLAVPNQGSNGVDVIPSLNDERSRVVDNVRRQDEERVPFARLSPNDDMYSLHDITGEPSASRDTSIASWDDPEGPEAGPHDMSTSVPKLASGNQRVNAIDVSKGIEEGASGEPNSAMLVHSIAKVSTSGRQNLGFAVGDNTSVPLRRRYSV
jgi:hypothetical protein